MKSLSGFQFYLAATLWMALVPNVVFSDNTCGGRLDISDHTDVVIESPNWPFAYPSWSECTWVITVPEGGKVRMTFQQFDLRNTHMVEIRDGADDSGREIGFFHGKWWLDEPNENGEREVGFTEYDMPEIISRSNQLYVKFDATNFPNDDNNGFRASIQYDYVNSDKVLLSGGDPKEPWILDISYDYRGSPKATRLHCPKLNSSSGSPKYLPMTNDASGAIVNGKPMVCGGIHKGSSGSSRPSKVCQTLNDQGEWIVQRDALRHRRKYSGSTVMQNQLVMVGGRMEGWSMTDTIEMVSPNSQSQVLPVTLPDEISSSCAVAWNATTFLVVGGVYANDDSNQVKTVFVNIENNRWSSGPTIPGERRYDLGCQEMLVGSRPYIVVLMGGTEKKTFLLDKSNVDQGWIEGMDIPEAVYDNKVVASLDKKRVYSIGGDMYHKAIFEFRCDQVQNCQRTKVPLRGSLRMLKAENGVAMTISEDFFTKLCYN